MARKKKNRKSLTLAERYPNLPTQQRMAHGGIRIRNNIAQVDEPLRIDKMLKNQVIDEMQHLYGMQIITLWTIANRPFLRAMKYEQRTNKTANFEFINLSRMGAEDQFHKTLGFMRERDRELIAKICFEELGAIEAGRQLGLPVNSITVYVRAAFDALGNALARMRDFKKELEAPPTEDGVIAG
jgi:hypothetical protein